jgi:RNA polymerase-binding transcription factor DksA
MSDLNIPEADWNERADQLENFGEHNAIEVELEEQLSLVNTAIEKIRAGNYGICITCKGEIERDRLEANPSAQTCKTCMK